MLTKNSGVRKRNGKSETEPPITESARHQRLIEQIDALHDPSKSYLERQDIKLAIIEENENFVHYIIDKFYHYTPSNLPDLMQAGKLGILQGLESYDPRRSKFGTYFTLYIKHEVSNEVARLSGVSSHTANNIKKVNKAIEDVKSKTGNSSPSVRDISVYSGMRPKAVEAAQSAKNGITPVSLDSSNDDDDDSRELVEKLPANLGNPVLECEEQEKTDVILNAIKRLPDVEQKAVIYRFGFDGEGNKSNIQVGKIMGIDASQVKRLVNHARRILFSDKSLSSYFSNYIKEVPAEEIPIPIKDYVGRELLNLGY